MPFAVIDFETTDLVPERTDRVVEIGVALTDDFGRIEHKWPTLVNPHRDIGATQASYMVALDSALLDREISRSEGKQLLASAEAAGLSRGTVARLHQDYLRAVAKEALADGVVTDEERSELNAVAAALGFGPPYVDEALAWAAAATPEVVDESTTFSLRPGDRVVFTGEMNRGRDEWVSTICAAGLASGGISKSTRLLVAADPDSQSGKAAKARQYGIPVVSEAAFEKMLATYRAAS